MPKKEQHPSKSLNDPMRQRTPGSEELKLPAARLSPRPKRRTANEPGHAHELTFSCYQGYQFMKAEQTCQWMAESIDAARNELEFDLWAYVIMPEHVHLIIYPKRAKYDMADIRKAIKAPVAVNAIRYLKENSPEWVAKITRFRGDRKEHMFWQSGAGYDRNIDHHRTLLEMIDYIHMNPVRRGLVERAIDWTWSSASWILDGRPGPIRLDSIPREWLIDAM